MVEKTKNKKILVLMSGGVDSSVAAVLLKKDGNKLIGVHLKLSRFCQPEDEVEARRVAEILKIPFYVFDISREYEEKIVQPMIKEYALGRTPNPDVECNRLIKFDLIEKKLKLLGFDFLATGHYARIESGRLYAAKDKNKDQSYFLWGIKRSRLKKILMPIGDYLKSEVRELAKKFNLPNFAKKDSQGICFLGDISLNGYLKEFLPIKIGQVLNSRGQVIGQHSGHYFLTEGQRHGLDLKNQLGPYYVALKKPRKNILVVAKATEPILKTKAVRLKKINWLVDPSKLSQKMLENIFVRVRYRQPLVQVQFDPGKKELKFAQSIRAVALGQSAVFYEKNKNNDFLLLGGGVIASKF